MFIGNGVLGTISHIPVAMGLDFHAGAVAPAVSHMFCDQESRSRNWFSHTVSDNCYCAHVLNALTCMYSTDHACITLAWIELKSWAWEPSCCGPTQHPCLSCRNVGAPSGHSAGSEWWQRKASACHSILLDWTLSWFVHWIANSFPWTEACFKILQVCASWSRPISGHAIVIPSLSINCGVKRCGPSLFIEHLSFHWSSLFIEALFSLKLCFHWSFHYWMDFERPGCLVFHVVIREVWMSHICHHMSVHLVVF